jgi:hypothetical protein
MNKLDNTKSGECCGCSNASISFWSKTEENNGMRERERVTRGWENCIMRSFILIIVLLVKYYYDDLIMED